MKVRDCFTEKKPQKTWVRGYVFESIAEGIKITSFLTHRPLLAIFLNPQTVLVTSGLGIWQNTEF